MGTHINAVAQLDFWKEIKAKGAERIVFGFD